jgi:hypothetical protein
VVERLNLADFGGHQLRYAACLFHSLPRFGQLDLLGAFGRNQKGDALARQCRWHDLPPSR